MDSCPVCGYNYRQTNRKPIIRSMLAKRRKSTQQLLFLASSKIKENIPSDATVEKQYRFILKIQFASDDVIKWATNRYLEAKHYSQAKGYAYLAAIICNHDKDRDVLVKREQSIRGSKPPIRKLQ